MNYPMGKYIHYKMQITFRQKGKQEIRFKATHSHLAFLNEVAVRARYVNAHQIHSAVLELVKPYYSLLHDFDGDSF